ncbi:MAG: hypothetical protein HY431_01995 [Candidatus Levybacteria bacterium]|nr:hypothetical protein [Candidatus Levybacteria bacterium]
MASNSELSQVEGALLASLDQVTQKLTRRRFLGATAAALGGVARTLLPSSHLARAISSVFDKKNPNSYKWESSEYKQGQEDFFTQRDFRGFEPIIENGLTTGVYALINNELYVSRFETEFQEFSKHGAAAIRETRALIALPETDTIVIPGLRPSFIPPDSKVKAFPEPIIVISHNSGQAFETHFEKPSESQEILELGEFIDGKPIPDTSKIMLVYVDLASAGRGDSTPFELRVFDTETKEYHIIDHGAQSAVFPERIITNIDENQFEVIGRSFEVDQGGYTIPKGIVGLNIDLNANKIVSSREFLNDGSYSLVGLDAEGVDSESGELYAVQFREDDGVITNDLFVIDTTSGTVQKISCSAFEEKVREQAGDDQTNQVFISKVTKVADTVWVAGFTVEEDTSRMFIGTINGVALKSGTTEKENATVQLVNPAVPLDVKPLPFSLREITLQNTIDENQHGVLIGVKRYGLVFAPTDLQGRRVNDYIFFPNGGLPSSA